MSGWSADNSENPPPAAGPGWSDAPASGPPEAWSAPEAPATDSPWALPEVGHIDPAAPTAPLAPAATATTEGRGWDDSAEPAPPPMLPVPLEAMTFTDIVDGAWRIIKARPKTVFAITAIIVLPTEILAAWIGQGGSSFADVLAGTFDSDPFAGSGSPLGTSGVYAAVLIQNLALFLLGGTIARLVSSWYAGGDLSAREAISSSLRKWPALLGAFAILVPVKVLGLATCGLALPFVIPLLMVTAPAIVVEDLGPVAGPLRSFRLAKRRYWPCVGVWALALVVELTVNLALSLVPALVSALAPADLEQVVGAAGTVFAAFITKPFVVGVAVLLYLDLRVRTEGLDLELDAAAAFTRAA